MVKEPFQSSSPAELKAVLIRDDSLNDPEYLGAGAMLREIMVTLALSLVMFLVINFVSARVRVVSVSMQPTLYEGDFVLVERLSMHLGQFPKRGDVVVFEYPLNPSQEPYIKRVIGLPGDTIAVQSGKVTVNGRTLEEDYISAPPAYNGEWVVPEGSLFVLGDNRNQSSDSHVWGMVPYENLIGRALVVYYPVQHWETLSRDPNGDAMAAYP
ncbi:MAG: hypothetical protein OHK0052_05310 [Anaerolineales bacterium]